MRYNPTKHKGPSNNLEGLKFKRDPGPAGRFIILQDSREQLPWDFGLEFRVHQEKLDIGDYSFGFRLHPDFDNLHTIRKMDRIFVVERKGSASEMVSMVGQERDRFQREIARLRFVAHPFIICEFTLEQFLEEAVQSGVNPTSAFGSICSWQKYMPVIFAGNKMLAKECFLVLARIFFKKYVLCHKRGKLGQGIVEEN